jgi:hypothetical protein
LPLVGKAGVDTVVDQSAVRHEAEVRQHGQAAVGLASSVPAVDTLWNCASDKVTPRFQESYEASVPLMLDVSVPIQTPRDPWGGSNTVSPGCATACAWAIDAQGAVCLPAALSLPFGAT